MLTSTLTGKIKTRPPITNEKAIATDIPSEQALWHALTDGIARLATDTRDSKYDESDGKSIIGTQESNSDEEYAPQLVYADPARAIPTISSVPQLPEDIWWFIIASLDYKSAAACYSTCRGLRAMLSESLDDHVFEIRNQEVFEWFARFPLRTHHQTMFVISPHMLLSAAVQLTGKVTRLNEIVIAYGARPTLVDMRTRLALHSFSGVTTLKLSSMVLASLPDMCRLICAFPNIGTLSHTNIFYKKPRQNNLENARSAKSLKLGSLTVHDEFGFSAIEYLLTAPMLSQTLNSLHIQGTDAAFENLLSTCGAGNVVYLENLRSLTCLSLSLVHCTPARPGHKLREFLMQMRPGGLFKLSISFDYTTFPPEPRDILHDPHHFPLKLCTGYFDALDETLATQVFIVVDHVHIHLSGIGSRNLASLQRLESVQFPLTRARIPLQVSAQTGPADEPNAMRTLIRAVGATPAQFIPIPHAPGAKKATPTAVDRKGKIVAGTPAEKRQAIRSLISRLKSTRIRSKNRVKV
ncbi:hypothetical protein CERSUDRAFT_115605 [Gelatoporia subvermispora B]|uniref:F-box domain-containing protein n=1 Tax=Ceriporiopsis subvermispora (strain B) TaxID=914234 RepID=M2PK00_CERS8|nr:hypothetical protein CERSUDRAFT_115605 [Gelatoporia subvermispora B]